MCLREAGPGRILDSIERYRKIVGRGIFGRRVRDMKTGGGRGEKQFKSEVGMDSFFGS